MTAATAWCRACGARAERGDNCCGRCGTPLEPPYLGPTRIGRVVAVKGRLGHRNGVALQESADGVRILVKGDETAEMPLADFDAASAVDVPGPAVCGAAGRLWKALRAQQGEVLRAKWNPEAVATAALQHAMVSMGARRAAALDALALGGHEMLASLGLPAQETCWYQARAAAAAGDTPALLGWLERLPAQGYPLRVRFLLSRVADLLRDGPLGIRAAAQLAPFAAADLDAQALHAALAAPGTADPIAPLLPFALAVEGAGGSLAGWASAIADLRPPATPFPDSMPTAWTLDTYLRVSAGADCAAKVDVLRLVPTMLLDDMIERGAISPELASQPGWNAANAAYLRCRLIPGEASAADLNEARFTAELARRYYLAGNSAELAALPADDDAVRHYGALAAWRSGVGQAGLEGLRPAARAVLSQLAAVRAAVQSGQEVVLPADLAADPTCWPLLWRSAIQGSLRLPGELAGRYQRFADWLDLCGIQCLLFESRWAEAITAGQALAARTALEVTSDEALNMVAYGQFQQGQPMSALQTLDEALGGRYTTGLLVNASVVAASLGSVAALPYLARITRSEQDQAVRSGAFQRAVDLWMQDAESPQYPEALRSLVREALALPQPDEFHRKLLRLACIQDTAWLAGDAIVRSEGSGQVDAARYRRTWARARTDGYKEDLSDVAKLLGVLAGRPSPPVWARQELYRFVKLLDDAVHTDFGEALGLVPTIEALLSAGVLELPYQLVFAAQAATHTAVYLSEHDGCVSRDYEQRMLFDTVRLYTQRQSELTEAEQEFVRNELTKCVVITARAVALSMIREWDNATERFNALVQRARVDYQNQYAIARMKRDIMDDELDPLVRRLRTYLNLIGELPLNDAGKEFQPLLSSMVSDWSAEIARLRPSL
ncbi:hypothetical protein [Trebonia sp.]|uniref:hypothetical protein n=1 Tax=Trebonia sp. TaxID=2767075 RepID=UPI00262BF6EF|nr:hypothetical protein [Trebonia sp.]